MASPPPQKPTRTELDSLLAFKRLDTATVIVCNCLKWAGLVSVSYFGYLSIGMLAGKYTFADIGLRVIGNLKVNDGIIGLLTGSGWAYGLAQRSLRRRNIERMAPLKNEYERLIDPNRTSSNLTSRGTTPSERDV